MTRTTKLEHSKRKQHLPKEPDSTDLYYQTRFEKYLIRPEKLSKLTYSDFWRNYAYTRVSYLPGEDDEDEVILNIDTNKKTDQSMKDLKGRPIYERRHSAVIRWKFCLPYGPDQEEYCLRILLEKHPVDNTEDWQRKLKGDSNTYLEQCIKEGLWDTDKMGLEFLQHAQAMGLKEYRIREIAGELIAGNFLTHPQFQSFFENHHFFDNGQDHNEGIVDGVNFVPEFGDFPVPVMDLKPLKYYIENFNEDQLRIFNYIRGEISAKRQVLAHIVGPAGTGKTFLINGLCALFRDSYDYSTNKTYAVLAPTGAAAHQIGGQTIHSRFRFDTHLKCNLKPNSIEIWILRYLGVLIIDEVSMVDEILMDAVERNMRLHALYNDQGKLFGGKHVILFGDPAQLPSRYKPWYCMSLFKKFKHFTMKTLVRQQGDPKLAKILQRIRRHRGGKDFPFPLDIERYFKSRITKINDQYVVDNNVSIIVATVKQVNEFNHRLLNLVKEKEFVFPAIDTDIHGNPLSELQKKRLMTKDEKMEDVLKIKKNSLVIIRRNINITAGLVNGRILKVDQIHEDAGVLILKSLDTDDSWPIRRIRQTIDDFGENRYVRHQFPIILGWAITVHRIQGKTLDKCIVNLDDRYFASGMGYVALTRTRRLEDLQLLCFDKNAIFLDAFYDGLLTWIDKNDFLLPEDQRDPSYPFPEWSRDSKYGIYVAEKDKKNKVKTEPTASQKIADKLDDFHIKSQEEPKPNKKKTKKTVPKPPQEPVVTYIQIKVPENGQIWEKCRSVLWQMIVNNVFVDNDTIINTFRQPNIVQFSNEVITYIRQLEQMTTWGDNRVQGLELSTVQHIDLPFNIQSGYHKTRVRSNGDCFYSSLSVIFFSNQNCGHLFRFGGLVAVVRQLALWDEFKHQFGKSAKDICLSLATSSDQDTRNKSVQIYSEAFVREEFQLDPNYFTWGTFSELLAVSCALNRPIDTYQAQIANVFTIRNQPRSQIDSNRKSVCLLLIPGDDHYWPLIPRTNASESVLDTIQNPIVSFEGQDTNERWYPLDTETELEPLPPPPPQPPIVEDFDDWSDWESVASESGQSDHYSNDDEDRHSTKSSVKSFAGASEHEDSESDPDSDMDISDCERKARRRAHLDTSLSEEDNRLFDNESIAEISANCVTILNYMITNRYFMNSDIDSINEYFSSPEVSEFIVDVKQLLRNSRPLTTNNLKFKNRYPDERLISAIRQNYRLYGVNGDGHCFYRAVALSILGNEQFFPIIRFGALVSVVELWNGFFGFFRSWTGYRFEDLCLSIATVNPSKVSKSVYSANMARYQNSSTYYWADKPQQLATSVAIDRPIDVWIINESGSVTGGRLAGSHFTLKIRSVVVQLQDFHFNVLIPNNREVMSEHKDIANPLAKSTVDSFYNVYPIGRIEAIDELIEMILMPQFITRTCHYVSKVTTNTEYGGTIE